MPAAGLDSIRRGLENFQQLGAGEVFALFHQADLRHFTGQGKGDENGAAIGQASHGFAAVGEGGESNLVDFGIGGHAASLKTYRVLRILPASAAQYAIRNRFAKSLN